MAQAMLRITLVKSAHGYESDQMATARALGLRRMHQSVVREDTPSLRGMVRKITHLVVTETVSGQEITPTFRRHRRPDAPPASKPAAKQPSPAKAPPPAKRQAAAPAEAAPKVVASPVPEPSRPAARSARAPAKTAAQAAPKQPARAKTAKAPAKAPAKTTKAPAKATKPPKAAPTSKSRREPKAK